MSFESILSDIISLISSTRSKKIVSIALASTLLSGCSITKETKYGQTKIKGNLVSMVTQCDNAKQQWLDLSNEIKTTIRNQINSDKNIKQYAKLIEKDLNEAEFPSYITNQCIESFDNIELEYIALGFMSVTLKFSIENGIQKRRLSIRKNSGKTLYTIELNPKIVNYELAKK